MLSILLVSRDVSLFADIFLRLGLKIIGSGFKQDSVDLQIFLGKLGGEGGGCGGEEGMWHKELLLFQ